MQVTEAWFGQNANSSKDIKRLMAPTTMQKKTKWCSGAQIATALWPFITT
jgi:hypothetical protein